MFAEENFSVRIPGTKFDLESNKLYRIIGRADESAPREFREREMTKIQGPLNTQSAVVDFDEDRKVFDTGFYEASPCYIEVSDKELVSETVKTLQDKVFSELERDLPDGFLSHKTSGNLNGKIVQHYFDDWKFPLKEDLTVSTKTANNFFGLWVALITGLVAPEKESKNPKYRRLKTPYVILDRKENASALQKRKDETNEAIYNFKRLIKSSKDEDTELLRNILEYTGMKGNVTTSDPSILNSQFSAWVEDKTTSLSNAKNFNEQIEYFTTKKGKDEMFIYKSLLEGRKKGVVIEKRGEYFLGEDSLGANLKQAAKDLLSNSSLALKLKDALE